jgi:hypothetical protein
MKFSTLTAIVGTAAAGLGHKAELSTIEKEMKMKMHEVKSADLMELLKDSSFETSAYQADAAQNK